MTTQEKEQEMDKWQQQRALVDAVYDYYSHDGWLPSSLEWPDGVLWEEWLGNVGPDVATYEQWLEALHDVRARRREQND